jgi:meiotic recombination protein REC8
LAAEQKVNGRAATQAKRNADFWIWQMGVSGIGRDGGAAVAPGLDMFYGENFINAVLGITPTTQGEKRDRGSAEGVQSDEEGRRVRPRTESPRDDEVGRGNGDAMLDDDGLPAINNDLVSLSCN